MQCSVIVRHYLLAEPLRAWILESSRPGLNSDSATCNWEISGEIRKISVPQFLTHAVGW